MTDTPDAQAESLPTSEGPRPRRRRLRVALLAALVAPGLVLASGLLLPSRPVLPVVGATPADWNPDSFWYQPWGESGVHHGIDIFAAEGAPVVAPVTGLVIQSRHVPRGGEVISVLGPKWRIHYHAHLRSRAVARGEWVRAGEPIGTVGTTGNAAGKPPHLHHAVLSLVPLPWRATTEPHGWKRAFYLDPGGAFEAAPSRVPSSR